MRTDIAGSTPRFRTLLAGDLESLLQEHRALVSHLATDHGGQIFRAEGDGYWLEFRSVTDAAMSAIAIQEALRLKQPTLGDHRLSMRIVIGLGDVSPLNGDLTGEALALISRVEGVTPSDEIYLTLAARLALVSSEIQTSLATTFTAQGFVEPVLVYRIETRHRAQVFNGAYILIADLLRFSQLIQTASVGEVERVLDTLDRLTNVVAREFEGTILFSEGDSSYLTFPQPTQLLAAAERLCRDWTAVSEDDRSYTSIQIVLHRGGINAYRSFLYGEGILIGGRVVAISRL
jgi:class 3 adenylate cyclase